MVTGPDNLLTPVQLLSLFFLGEVDFPVDEIPASPRMDAGLDIPGHGIIVGTEKMDEVLGVEENAALLLTLNGKNMLPGWSDMLQHIFFGDLIDVKVGQVTESGAVLVRRLGIRLLVGEELARAEQSDEAFAPASRPLGVVERDVGKSRGRVVRTRHGLNGEIGVAICRGVGDDEQGMLAVTLPGVQNVPDTFVPSQSAL